MEWDDDDRRASRAWSDARRYLITLVSIWSIGFCVVYWRVSRETSYIDAVPQSAALTAIMCLGNIAAVAIGTRF